VAVGPDVLAYRPAEDPRERQPGRLADDVPEREVDAGDGRRADDAVPVPEMLAIHHLPEMLRPRRILADEQFGKRGVIEIFGRFEYRQAAVEVMHRDLDLIVLELG